jgi:integrase/recombinase XerD
MSTTACSRSATGSSRNRASFRCTRAPSPPSAAIYAAVIGPAGETALLVSMAGTRLLATNVSAAFATLRARAGIEPRSARCRPRVHDLRHAHAVHTILDAYRAGQDTGPRLALLATYLGHVDPSSSYWYLEATPELMAAAGERLERYLETLR